MPLITDWMMVGITVVYVIATILIWVSNRKSANASREAISLSREQFEENNRLNALPFLQVENRSIRDTDFSLKLSICEEGVILMRGVVIKNIGRSAAKNIVYTWKYAGGSKCDVFPINGIMQGDEYGFDLKFCNTDFFMRGTGVLLFEYDDILGHNYSQKIIFHFEDGELLKIESDQPVYSGA